MIFPNLVYRCPGLHACPGGTYEYKAVNDEDELTAAIKDGWFPSLPFAMNPAEADLSEFEPESTVPPVEADLSEFEPTVALKQQQFAERVGCLDGMTRKELIEVAKGLGLVLAKKDTKSWIISRIVEAEGL